MEKSDDNREFGWVVARALYRIETGIAIASDAHVMRVALRNARSDCAEFDPEDVPGESYGGTA